MNQINYIDEFVRYINKGVSYDSIKLLDAYVNLKKYMEDFSLLDEKEVPDLTLWEQYLVYATTFGISEKVLKQLKMKFPELQDDNYFRNTYSSLYYCTNYKYIDK